MGREAFEPVMVAGKGGKRMASRANGAERWSIVTGEDGDQHIESQRGGNPMRHRVDIVNTNTGARELLGIYSEKAEALQIADWFGMTGSLRAEIVSSPN